MGSFGMINRKMTKVLLLLGSFLASQAYALGLGNITLQSNLNEPLSAEIQLVALGEVSANAVLVNLAPQEDFDKAAVERTYLLNSLVFQLDASDSNNPVIVVSSASPIREPSLNFIVELRSPSGRVLREYTLLLDIEQGGTIREPAQRPTMVVKRAAKKSKPAVAAVEPASAASLAPAPAPAPASAPAPAQSVIDAAAEAAAQSELAAQLVVAQEQANRAVADSEALKKQAIDLERQLAEANTQLNDQNTQLQSMKTALDAAAATKQVAVVEPAPAPAPASQGAAPQPTDQPVVEPVVVAPPAVVEPAPAPAPAPQDAAPQPTEQPAVVEPATPAAVPATPAAVPASQPAPQGEPDDSGSLGTTLTAVLAVLLIAVGLWFVRKRQQPDDAEQSSTATATAGSTADVETDQMMAQYSAEHPLQAQEAPEPLTEEKPLSTDEALDLLLAEADLGIAEVPAEAVAAAQPEIEAPVMEALADDALELSDDLMPTVELEDWSVDTLATEAAPAVDKEFVFEPELFVDEVVAAPEVAEVPAAAQPEPVVDDAFHDATDRDFVVTKLELARQYLEMSDAESARDLLQEVLEEGDEELKQAATDLLKKIS